MPVHVPALRAARRRALVAATLLIALLATPALAHAESLTLAVASDPVAGLPSGVDYEYDTGGVPMNLTVITRSASGPECQPTSVMDDALVGAQGGTYLTPAPIAVSGHGGARIPYTFPSAGAQRVCAWLYRTPDDVAAAAGASAQVRLPNSSLTVTGAQIRPRPAGSDLQVHATGSIEAAADLLVTAVPASDACPPAYDENAGLRAFDITPSGTPTRVTGAFDLTFGSRARLPFGVWRVCAYLQDGTVAEQASATGTTTVELVLKPSSLRKPRVRRIGGALSCDGGRWRGRPAPKLTYAWLAGARKLPAKGRRLAITPATTGKAVRCRVTAINKAGKATGTSAPLRVR
jgi:hypothetical protein